MIDIIYPMLMESMSSLEKDFQVKYEDEYEVSDIAITYGLHKYATKGGRVRKAIFDGQEKAGKDMLIMERGFLKRSDYFSLGFSNVNGRAEFYNHKSPSDRYKELGIELSPWRVKEDGIILLCGQVAWDTNVQHINYTKEKSKSKMIKGYLNWLRDTAIYLSETYDKDVIFRPHPLFAKPSLYKEALAGVNIGWSDRSLEKDLKDSYVCVAFNSNTLVDAAIMGVPIVAFDRGSMAYPISNNMKKLNKLKLYKREQLLFDIAYSQWNSNEILKGIPWQRLKKSRYDS